MQEITITYSTGTTPTDDPTITATPNALVVPNQVVNAYDGTQTATLDVEGSNLTDNVTIALNGGTDSKFEMTIDNGQTWHSTLSLEQNGGEVTIRLKDNLEVGDYYDVITLSSEGATDVTVNVSGSVTTPPTYTVTYNSNGGSGTMTDENSPYLAGVEVTLLENTFTAPEDMIWDSWQVKDASDNDVTVTEGKFTMPASNVTVTAQWVTDPNAPEYEWVLTDLASLTENDVFVIVGDNGSTYAMTNDNGTGSAPDATAVIVVANKLSVAPADSLKWTIGGNATDGYTFYPNGSTTTWLYCTNTNNGVRVGNNTSKTFKMDANSGYLKHDGTSRYIGIYNSSDWRCYTSAGGNIADQTFAFYKRQVASNEPSITLASYEVEVNANVHTTPTTIAVTYANIDFENNVPEVVFYEQDGSTEAIYDWLFVDLDADWNVYYTIDEENTNNAARTAYFKVLGYDSNGNNVYSDLASITQTAPAPKYTARVASNISNGTVMIVDGTSELEIIEVEDGTEVTLTYTAEAGYALGEWNVYKDGDETVKVTVSNNKFNMPAYDVVISATFAEATTYTLITSIDELVSGKRYVIAGSKNDIVYVLGKTGDNNRPGVAVETSNNTIIGNENICEVVIIGPDADGFYTLYDVANAGYLYAASGTSNYLKAQSPTDNNGRWTIIFENEAANIVAQGSNSRNILRFNKNGQNNPIFSCYGSGQQPIYLYAKNNEATVSCEMAIDGYGTSDGNWYLIASPVGQVTPTEANGFLTPDYDLYRFDQTQEQEWRNYKQQPFNLVSGHGYLYANSGNVTLTFEGYPYVGSGQVFLSYTEGNNWAGWNLIGNPFNAAATIPDTISYYTMNEDGSDFATGESFTIGAMEGIFVKTAETGKYVTFTQSAKANAEHNARLVLNLNSNSKLIDRAIVRFGEGQTLPKFMLNEAHTKLYFTQNGTDYAVVRSEGEGEMPINFKAEHNGTYTIGISAKDMEFSRLRLIDNMTGADIDLLATPSYTFEAKTTDYASRFRLVFSSTGIEENENANFAYYNGSEWVINATDNATVEVIDMMGRVVLSGTNTIATNDMQAGVYVIRLVDGNNVKTQKIVVR